MKTHKKYMLLKYTCALLYHGQTEKLKSKFFQVYYKVLKISFYIIIPFIKANIYKTTDEILFNKLKRNKTGIRGESEF